LIPTIQLNAVQVLALAAFGVFAGEWIKRRLPILERLSIPGSILGGLFYAVLILALRQRIAVIEPNLALRDVLMIACFTIIGMNASVRIIRRGGGEVFMLLLASAAGAVLQNALGMGLARLLGLNPLVGILAGAVSLAGGPATSLAFGSTFERAGVGGATAIALASATFGIAVSGLLAGTAGAFLIRRYSLKPAESSPEPKTLGDPAAGAASLLTHVLLIAVAMGLGNLVSAAIERAGVVLPGYIGAMIVAAILRNIDDHTGWLRLSPAQLSSLFGIALPLFIVMAMLALRLWDLASVASPLLVVLVAQVVLTWALSVTVAFFVVRRDFEGAVMATGYCGFMLGITANALATMDEVSRRFGPAPRAFIVVPVVGAFLIDFTNALIITVMMNFGR
jgi:ESS family glutamate:Na+ symporter